MDLPAHYLSELITLIDRQKQLAEGAIGQLSDDELFRAIDSE
jgi:hypothetical protein